MAKTSNMNYLKSIDKKGNQFALYGAIKLTFSSNMFNSLHFVDVSWVHFLCFASNSDFIAN